MDDRGNFYAGDDKAREQLLSNFANKTEMVGDMATMPKNAIPIDNDLAASLASLNHRCRRIFYSEVRRGASQWNALETARSSLPKGAGAK